MKNTILAAAAIALTTGLFSTSAFAGPKTPGVDTRQKVQKVRIVHGVANGSLKVGETVRLLRGQRRINRAERRAKSDGVVTGRERARLHRMQNKQSRKIRRFKHN